MERRASIPGWVARRGWSRKNPLWVRTWLDRKPKAKRGGAPAEARTANATILSFAREPHRG